MLWRVATTEVLLLLGTVGMTLGVIGVFALRDTYARLHSASNAMLMGVFTMLLAALVAGPSDVVARAVLVGVFLFLTAPAGAHALARLELHRRRDAPPRDT